MTQNEQYLDLLSVFHYVVGGLTALFSCIPFLHLGIGIAILGGAFNTADAPPEFIGWFLVVFPALFIIAGWTLAGLIIVAGKKLKKRNSWTYCVVVAGLECIVMPFGTVLGVFTLIVLLKDSVKKLFTDRKKS